MTPDRVTIQVAKAPDSDHDHQGPFSWQSTTLALGSGLSVAQQGTSGPLDASGTSWGSDSYAVDHEGRYLITVQLQATVGEETHYDRVDPELVIGTKSTGSVFSRDS